MRTPVGGEISRRERDADHFSAQSRYEEMAKLRDGESILRIHHHRHGVRVEVEEQVVLRFGVLQIDAPRRLDVRRRRGRVTRAAVAEELSDVRGCAREGP
jgi:hypothetical protein